MRNSTRSVSVLTLFPLAGTLAAAQQEPSLGGVSYAAGDWLANGFGNHRAVVEVTGAADAARGRLRLILVEQMVDVYVDDVLVINRCVPELRPGAIGLAARGGAVAFEQIRYTTP